MTATNRRQRGHRGSAWYWRQTDCWYYTPKGTKKRVPLLNEDGKRVRGAQNRQAAGLALARAKLATDWRPQSEIESPSATAVKQWLVADICSRYIEQAQKRVQAGRLNAEYGKDIVRSLNDLCTYCGALPTNELKKGHVQYWIESHLSWRPVTRRNVLTIVLAAFNHAQREYDVQHVLRGLKKPPHQPRLHSFSEADEKAVYGATDKVFRNFLFAAVNTGLRPFCELARLTVGDIEETPLGMMWRIKSSKTGKTRKIPVRPEVARLVHTLIGKGPVDKKRPIFLNPQGRPWKKVTGVARFLAIKRILGWDRDPLRKQYSTYTCRHTFAHRMLSGYWNGGQGCSIEVLAELMGNTPKVAFDHYGREWGQHFQDPLWAAVGVPSQERRKSETKRRPAKGRPKQPR